MNRSWSRSTRNALRCAVVAAIGLGTQLGGTEMAQAAPPPAPAAPVVVFTEAFENVTPPTTPVLLPAYIGPAPTNTTYTADPYYLMDSACNGIITSFNSSANANCAASGPNFDNWNRTFARSLGTVTNPATETDNHALVDFTTNGTSPANGVMLETVNPIPAPGGSRFLAFSVQVSAAFCNQPAGQPLLAFYLLNGATALPSFTQPINPCTATGSQDVVLTVPGVGDRSFRVGSFATDSAVLFSGTSLGLRLVNQRVVNGLGGNDLAIDNIRVLDATPQLSKDFAPGAASGRSEALTFTIINTTEMAAKAGWSFTDTLPAGMTVATPAASSTTCTGGVVTAAAGSGSIAVTGNLDAGQVSCTVTVSVTAGTGTFTNGPSNVTSSGLNPITPTSVTFTPAPTLVNDTPVTAPNTPVTFNPLANDSATGGATLVPTSVRLLDGGGNPQTTVTNVDGSYSVNTTTGFVTFTPAVGFIGTAAPVPYRVTDSNGVSSTATITPTTTNNSSAVNDNVTVSSGTPTTFNPLANDVPPGGGTFDPTSVRLIDGGGNPTTSLSNPDGTYTVNTTTGQVTFTPTINFTGPSTPVTYRVTDSLGTARTATITVAVPVVGIPLVSGLPGLLALALAATGGLAFLLRRRRSEGAA